MIHITNPEELDLLFRTTPGQGDDGISEFTTLQLGNKNLSGESDRTNGVMWRVVPNVDKEHFVDSLNLIWEIDFFSQCLCVKRSSYVLCKAMQQLCGFPWLGLERATTLCFMGKAEVTRSQSLNIINPFSRSCR